jgi:hypothetical protein
MNHLKGIFGSTALNSSKYPFAINTGRSLQIKEKSDSNKATVKYYVCIWYIPKQSKELISERILNMQMHSGFYNVSIVIFQIGH